MKKIIVSLITTLFFIVLFFSCATEKGNPNIKKTATTTKKSEYGYEREAPVAPISEYLARRVWILAGCKFNDEFKIFSANLTTSRIRFISGSEFEATSGISNYYGNWKLEKSLSKFAHKIFIKIKDIKIIDETNIIGIPFDRAFKKNIDSTAIIEIDQYSIRFYSKNRNLLLHFVRS